MEKTASVIFAFGTMGLIVILLNVQLYSLCCSQCILTILACVGMECCSLLPIIIETENKEYAYEL